MRVHSLALTPYFVRTTSQERKAWGAKTVAKLMIQSAATATFSIVITALVNAYVLKADATEGWVLSFLAVTVGFAFAMLTMAVTQFITAVSRLKEIKLDKAAGGYDLEGIKRDLASLVNVKPKEITGVREVLNHSQTSPRFIVKPGSNESSTEVYKLSATSDFEFINLTKI